MDKASSSVKTISDTASWVACFRARETDRSDALFRDPYAAQLAGERGFEMARSLADGNKHEWSWAARTYLFDKFLTREIQNGADLIVNLAAGLDARPYRMDLPENIQWVEVDLPDVISHKEGILAEQNPRCRLERIRLDLSDKDSRRALLRELDRRAKQIVVVCEGLLLYFTHEEVASLASDLACEASFQSWIIDLVSPGQLRLIQRTWGRQLSRAGAVLKFAPLDGAHFFAQYGWKPDHIEGLMTTAANLGRLPSELNAFLPEPKGNPGNFPWTGVCVLKRH